MVFPYRITTATETKTTIKYKFTEEFCRRSEMLGDEAKKFRNKFKDQLLIQSLKKQ